MEDQTGIPFRDFYPPCPEAHDDLAHDLAVWLNVKMSRVTFENMEVRSGSRPDVYSLNRSFQPQHAQAWTHEVKTTRDDFTYDISRWKWQKYLPFSHKVFFACPKGLINPEDLPQGVGLWWRSPKIWRSVKRAYCIGDGLDMMALYRCALGKYKPPPLALTGEEPPDGYMRITRQ